MLAPIRYVISPMDKKVLRDMPPVQVQTHALCKGHTPGQDANYVQRPTIEYIQTGDAWVR